MSSTIKRNKLLDSVGNKDIGSKMASKGTDTGETFNVPIQQILLKQPSEEQKNCVPAKKTSLAVGVPPVCNKEEEKQELKAKPVVILSTEKPTDCNFTNLKNVVNKLEKISQRFATSHFKDSYHTFGKYIAVLLRGLPKRKFQQLKIKIIKDILRAKHFPKLKTFTPKSSRADDSHAIDSSISQNSLHSSEVTPGNTFTSCPDGALPSILRNSLQNTGVTPQEVCCLPALETMASGPSSDTKENDSVADDICGHTHSLQENCILKREAADTLNHLVTPARTSRINTPKSSKSEIRKYSRITTRSRAEPDESQQLSKRMYFNIMSQTNN